MSKPGRTRHLRHANAEEKPAVLVLVSSITNGQHKRLLYEHKLSATAKLHLARPEQASQPVCDQIYEETSPQRADRFALARKRQRAWNRSGPSFDDLGARSGSVI
jgi:hypothetical protein